VGSPGGGYNNILHAVTCFLDF